MHLPYYAQELLYDTVEGAGSADCCVHSEAANFGGLTFSSGSMS